MFTSSVRVRGVGVLAAAVAALALPASATALKPADVPDIGVDTGRFSLPIKCAISVPVGGAAIKVFDLNTTVDVQGVAATELGAGQKFWLTQGSGSITFPSWLTSLGGLATVQRADATIPTLDIGADNATPSAINVADLQPLSIRNIPIRFGQTLKVGLPLQGTFDVGPYTAPDSGVVTLRFNRAVANIALKSFFNQVLLRVRADCRPTANNALLSIVVSKPAGLPESKILGQPLNFPAVPSGYLIGIINAPYRCTLGGQPLDVGIAVGGTIPLAVRRTGSLLFEESSGAMVLPPESVNALLDRGITRLSGKVTMLNLDVGGGLPAVQNVAAAGIDIPETPLVRGQKLVVSLPVGGTLTAGPFTLAPGSNNIQVALGDAKADFRLNGSSTVTPAACTAPDPGVILVDAPAF